MRRQALLHAAQCRDSRALKTCACVLPPRFALVRRAVTRPWCLLCAQHVVLAASRPCAAACTLAAYAPLELPGWSSIVSDECRRIRDCSAVRPCVCPTLL
ncbi:hypothetical protein TRVL_07540 [Trypanosoma vivax]|nr:hypothetical protein TRVL_07540 [Trypanosoma vivax]